MKAASRVMKYTADCGPSHPAPAWAAKAAGDQATSEGAGGAGGRREADSYEAGAGASGKAHP